MNRMRVRSAVAAGAVVMMSVMASAATVRIVSTDEIPSVSNRTGTVQDRLVDVNTAIYAAKRGAPKGTKFLVVGKNGNLLDDQAFNAALPHFESGDIYVAMPADARKRLTELSAMPSLPSTVVPADKWSIDTWAKRCAWIAARS